MLLQNLYPKNGHCNWARYIITNLMDYVIEAKIASGYYADRQMFIPRIPHNSQESEFPFEVRRKQFPVKPALAITANKAQGQTMDKIGVHLPTPLFSHGQLYVAQSKVRSKRNITKRREKDGIPR